MKRFMVFAGCDYYPSGGMSDFQISFDIQEVAIDHAKVLCSGLSSHAKDWAQVYDIKEMEMVLSIYL